MQPVEPETAYILFADVVAFSLLALEAQAEVTSRFRDVARRVSSAHACDLLLDSGDGAALIFFGRVRAAVECTLQLGEELRSSSIEARLGLHCGTVSRIRDINDRPNAIGPGLNLAERVMSSGDAGHILLSGAAAEIVSQETALGGSLLDFGEHEVKHGVRVRLFSLVTDQCGRGDLPEKLRTSGATKRKNNFTSPERQFVGRRTELESLKQRLESGQERLITITGPGGIGKSRLALQAAVDGADNYADGAWIVECDTLRNSEDLLLQIAHVLEVPIGGSPLSSVLSALSQRQILLVLDCFERLVPHAAAVEELLKHSRELQIVATSRTLLGLPRESEFVLGPFPTDHGSGGADAVALFASAARQASPDFAVGRQNRETVEAIIEFVEGIPLAIILAAGRLRHLSLAELRTQLSEHRLDILRRRSPGEDRHSDLRRVVDDSFTLLTERLKDLLVYLSVFKGFALGDATEVVSNVPNVLDGISELRENSLLTAVVTADQMRYRTLDVVAEYLESAAKSYELDPVRRRHALYFTHKAVGVRELYEDGRWREGSAAVTADLGNFRRAIEYAVGSKEPELVRPLARSLCRILMESGFLSDFEVLSEAAQRIAEVEHDLETLVEITGLRGGVFRRARRFEEAEKAWLERARYCAALGDAEKEADTWLDLADMATVHGDASRAEAFIESYAKLEPRLSQGLVLASGHVAKARVSARRGDRSGSTLQARKAWELADLMPVRTHSFYIWCALADVYNEIGEPISSEDVCLEAIPETLSSKHFSYCGQLLLRLCESLDIQERTQEAAQTLAIAQMIPKSISVALRDQLRTLREEFVKANGQKVLRDEEIMRIGLDWQLEALVLVESLAANAKARA